jgi:hypothetical protein
MRRNPLGSQSLAFTGSEPSLNSKQLFIDGIYHVDTYVRPINKKRKDEAVDINIDVNRVTTDVLTLGE